jgi:RNA polymerase primary sigma factor
MKQKETNKKLDIDQLIAKGKKDGLSTALLDEALEEMDFDMDSLDKLYESLEENEIPIILRFSVSDIFATAFLTATAVA